MMRIVLAALAALASLSAAADEGMVRRASGLVGQSVSLFRVVLYTAVLIIFAVALVIINNAVVMATLQRRREFGTLRAIGAQKGFVLGLVLMETVALGLAFGTLGSVLGSGIVLWLSKAGIPAGNEFLYFFFKSKQCLRCRGKLERLDLPTEHSWDWHNESDSSGLHFEYDHTSKDRIKYRCAKCHTYYWLSDLAADWRPW